MIQDKKNIRKAIVIGSDDNAIDLCEAFRASKRWETISIIDPVIENAEQLAYMQSLDMVIVASDEPQICEYLRTLKLPGADIISQTSARRLFLSDNAPVPIDTLADYRKSILDSLQELRHSIYLTKNKVELLKMILSVSLKSLTADSGSIMLIDQNKHYLTIEMAEGLESHIVKNVQQDIDKGISGRVVRTGRPMLITGKVAKEDSSIEEERTDLHSAICCPILIGNCVVGVINVNSKLPEKSFCPDDIQHICALASFTAEIIEASREYEHTINASFAISILDGIRDIMHLDLPLQEHLNLSMMKLVNSLEGKLCNLYRFDPESNQFIVLASSSFSINLYSNDQIRLNDFFTDQILRLQKSFIFNVRIGTSDFKKWFIAHPIIHDNSITGLLMLHLISDKTHFNKERALLEKVALLLQESLPQTLTIQDSRCQSVQNAALSDMVFDLAGINNVRQLAMMLVVNACMILEAESCVLNLYNNVMDSFEILESFSIKGKDHLNQINSIDKTISVKGINATGAVIVDDVNAENNQTGIAPALSAMTMCLYQNDVLMGALSVYDKNAFGTNERYGFSEHDKDIFVKFCAQATNALNRFFIMRTGE